MIYLLYGTKEYLIKEEIKKISKDFTKINIINYNLENDQLKIVLEDSKTISIFSEKKLIICENANIFTSQTNKDADLLLDYLNNPNPSTTLIFTVNEEKIDSRKKITKKIKEIGKVKEFNEEIKLIDIAKNYLKDFKISSDNLNLLVKRVGNNPLILIKEIEKIKIYKDDDNITKEDILNLTNKKVEINIFKLIDYIIQNKKNEALEMYNEMLKINEEPIKIIIILANQFRIMYQSKELTKMGLREKEIAEVLGIHPYRVKLALQNSRPYSSDLLLNYINTLADIDIDIKTGKKDKNIALELFILNIKS